MSQATSEAKQKRITPNNIAELLPLSRVYRKSSNRSLPEETPRGTRIQSTLQQLALVAFPPRRLRSLLDPARAVTFVLECHDIQQGADMTQRVPECFSLVDWSLVTIVGNSMPPRDPNDDDGDDEDEDSDTEPDDEREPAVVREPDEDE